MQDLVRPRSQDTIKERTLPRSRTVALAWTLAGGVIGALSLLPQTPRLVWNYTPSAPLGLYRIDAVPFARGDLLAISPEGPAAEVLLQSGALPSGRLLLKPLAAQAPDTVCRSGEIISINGRPAAVALPRTSAGAAMPRWSGCIRLGADDIFVLSSHSASLDSRYFGAVPRHTVIGVARPLLTAPFREPS